MDDKPVKVRKTAAEMATEARGGVLECPYCGCRDFRVLKTWWTKAGEKHCSFICRHCGKYEFNAKVEKTITPI